MRFRTNSGDTRAQLQGVTIRAANVRSKLGDAENVVASGVNLDDQNAWYQVDFAKSKCRFIRLEFSQSAHTDPNITRIRSIQVRVGVTNHDK